MVAVALKLGELVAYLKTDNSALRRGLREGEAETRESGDRMGRSMTATAMSVARAWATSWAHVSGAVRRGHRDIQRNIEETKERLATLAALWGRTGDKSLLGDMDRERSHLRSLEAAAKELGTGGFRSAMNAAQAFGGAAVAVGTNLLNLIYIVTLLVAALAAVQAVGMLVGGLLGALPGLTTGALAGVAALVLGVWGLGDAFRQTARSGGSMVDKARQIMLAERQLAAANREAADAQEDLNRARLSAKERMEDLARSLAGSRLDEEAAVQAVADAEENLRRARETGDPARIARAELAYRQALQQLEETRDRVEDLAAEQKEAAEKGVEGSDEVTAAMERQRRAVEGVSDAEYELRRARTSGGGGAAAEVTRISESAQAAVKAIKALGPAYTELRLMVQEALFKGVDKEIIKLSDAWMPTLRTRLTSMASMFNGLFKEWAETSRNPEFIENIAAGWKSVEDMIGRIGSAVAGPGLEAFGKLSKAAKPMIDAIGDGVADLIEDFAAWIDKSERSGKLQEFFDKAAVFFRNTLTMGKTVASILGSIISILSGSGTDKMKDGTAFDKVNAALEGLDEWLEDPNNQKRIQEFLQTIYSFFDWIVTDAVPTVDRWIGKLQDWADKVDGWAEKARDFRKAVVGALMKVGEAVDSLPGRIRSAAMGMWDPVKDGFKAAVNWIIGKWNGLEFKVGGGSFAGVTIPSTTFGTPDIPYLARGGWIPPKPGGTLARLAEAGQPEWALPDQKLRAALDEAVRRGRAGGDGASQMPAGDTVIENHIHIGDEVVRVVKKVVDKRDRELKRTVTAGAGNRNY